MDRRMEKWTNRRIVDRLTNEQVNIRTYKGPMDNQWINRQRSQVMNTQKRKTDEEQMNKSMNRSMSQHTNE